MSTQRLRVTGLLVLLGLAGVSDAWAADPAPQAAPDNTSTTGTSSQTVKGEVVKIEGAYYVVKDQQGKEFRLLVSKDTEMAGVFKPGDKIEVQTSPIEHAMFIASAGTQPREEGTAPQTITGELVKIEGHFYIVMDHLGKELRLHVSEDTKLSGSLKPGARIEALVSPVEHAMFIKAGK